MVREDIYNVTLPKLCPKKKKKKKKNCEDE